VTTGAIKGNEDGFSVDDSAHAAARPYGYCSQERRRDAVQRPTTLCLVAIFKVESKELELELEKRSFTNCSKYCSWTNHFLDTSFRPCSHKISKCHEP